MAEPATLLLVTKSLCLGDYIVLPLTLLEVGRASERRPTRGAPSVADSSNLPLPAPAEAHQQFQQKPGPCCGSHPPVTTLCSLPTIIPRALFLPGRNPLNAKHSGGVISFTPCHPFVWDLATFRSAPGRCVGRQSPLAPASGSSLLRWQLPATICSPRFPALHCPANQPCPSASPHACLQPQPGTLSRPRQHGDSGLPAGARPRARRRVRSRVGERVRSGAFRHATAVGRLPDPKHARAPGLVQPYLVCAACALGV